MIGKTDKKTIDEDYAAVLSLFPFLSFPRLAIAVVMESENMIFFTTVHRKSAALKTRRSS